MMVKLTTRINSDGGNAAPVGRVMSKLSRRGTLAAEIQQGSFRKWNKWVCKY